VNDVSRETPVGAAAPSDALTDAGEQDVAAPEGERPAPDAIADADHRLVALFGAHHARAVQFHGLLRQEGVLRGLIGPRETSRLWERHLVNSAAVVPFLPTEGDIVDVGSGAGLPGIVIAIMRPQAQVILVEPMERRTTWLGHVVEELELSNVDIRRGRADEYHGAFQADAVTSRAVAPLEKLARWTLPLVRKGGQLVVLKGRSAETEIEVAGKVLRKYGATDARVADAPTLPDLEPTRVVVATRTR